MLEVEVSKVVQLSGHSGSVYALSEGHEQKTVFTGSIDQFVAEWNIETGTAEKFAVKLESPVYSLCHIQQKNLLLVGLSNGSIHIIDLKEKKEVKHFLHHKKAVFDIQYSSVTGCFYSLDGEGNLAVWQLEGFQLLRTIPLCDAKLRSLAFNEDHSQLAVACGDGFVRLFETTLLNEIAKLGPHEKSANCVVWHPNGNWLITSGWDAHVKIWDVNNWELIDSIPAHNYAVYSMGFNADNSLFVTGSRDKTVKVWDAEKMEVIERLDRKSFGGHLNSVNKILWSAYNDLLITTGDDRSIIVWDIKTKQG